MSKELERLQNKLERLRLEIKTNVLEYQRDQLKKRTSKRNYEGASHGDRMKKWKVPAGSGPNTILRPALRTLRERCRDLVRNNSLGESAAAVMVSGIVGSGITPTINNRRLAALWKDWAESTQCDATGISNLCGLQTLAARAWAESGEVLFRRVIRDDWRPGEIPFAIQLLEPDYIDDSHGVFGSNYQLGVKVNDYGAPVAYRLFQRHPYENEIISPAGLANLSVDVPVADVGHLFLRRRIGQIRGVPALSPVIVRMRDLDEFEDAQLVRQKLAACFMAFITDVDGEGKDNGDEIEVLEPGIIEKLGPGKSVQFASPPGVSGYGEYTSNLLHRISAGIGIPYEDFTGDYSKVSWSSGRLARMKFYGNLDVWQWQMFIPQFCGKIFSWFKEGAAMMGVPCKGAAAEWTAPRRPVADLNEYVRLRDEIRAGLKSIPEGIRENGYNPDEIIRENAAFLVKADEAGLVFDCDPRRTGGSGQGQPFQAESGIPPVDGGVPMPPPGK